MAVSVESRRGHATGVMPRAARAVVPRPFPPVVRNAGAPSLRSTRVLVFLALAGLAALVYNQYLEELQDQADIEDALAALAEAEEHGTIPWEDIKRRHGL